MPVSPIATLSCLEEQYESLRDCSYDVGRFVDIVSVKIISENTKRNEACCREWEAIRKAGVFLNIFADLLILCSNGAPSDVT